MVGVSVGLGVSVGAAVAVAVGWGVALDGSVGEGVRAAPLLQAFSTNRIITAQRVKAGRNLFILDHFDYGQGSE